MKKNLIWLAFLVVSTFCFATSILEFSEKQNPFIDEFYMQIQPSDYKNKVIKTISEDYDISTDGNTYYGDTTEKHQIIFYYIFNQNGYITDKYYIYANEVSKPFYKKHWTYSYDETTYTITEQDLLEKETITKTYKIEKQPLRTILTYEGEYKRVPIKEVIVLEQNKKSVTTQVYDWEPDIKETTYSKETRIDKIYNGEKLRKTNIFYKGRAIKETQHDYLDTDELSFFYDFDETYVNGVGLTTISRDNKIYNEKKTSKITRQYNKYGFIEKETTIPIDSVEGNYTIYECQILPEKDETFYSYFE